MIDSRYKLRSMRSIGPAKAKAHTQSSPAGAHTAYLCAEISADVKNVVKYACQFFFYLLYLWRTNQINRIMLFQILISILALLWELFVILGLIGLFIWLWQGLRSMHKGDGPGSLPWL